MDAPDWAVKPSPVPPQRSSRRVLVIGTVVILVLAAAIAIPILLHLRVAANETSAQAVLKQIVTVEHVWRQTDADGNGVQDYWTRDVAGLFGVADVSGGTLKYIDVQFAKADCNRVQDAHEYKDLGIALARADRDTSAHDSVVGEAAPRAGYWFGVMKLDEKGAPYQHQLGSSPGPYTNEEEFGFCAWPATYNTTGVRTFIVNQAGVIYAKDTGGQPIDRWPAVDPTTQGWVAVD